MTYHFTPYEEAPKSACALLWLADIDAKHLAAPESLGGQRFEEQERIVRAHAARDGFNLTDSDLTVVDMPVASSMGVRLGCLIEFVKRRPTSRLYVPGSVFADLSPADVCTYITALADQNTDLVFCAE